MKRLKEVLRWEMIIALLVAALVSVTLTGRLAAQDQPDQDDPPSRVARLAYLQGSVSFQPAGESEWVEAVTNRPMTIGDQLWVDRDSRAELGLGSAVIDVNSNTGVSFLNLDDHTVQVQLSSGAINIRVRRLGRDDVFEVDTPNQAFSIFESGRYRVEASEDGTYSVVSIREGEGESTGNGQTYTVEAGQRATFEGTDRLNARIEDIGDPDDFDNWCYGRDRRYESSMSARYVSHDVVGYEDLDGNGDWRPSMGYGDVWFPHVYAGWAPYREGHWAWIDPWGWTWVDNEPWGYAPFHYGRWVSIGGQWGWLPGPIAVAPVYAPALVVFVGGGPGGFGGNVGWFPLGPREVYVPSYRVSRGYVERVNISNTTVNATVITNVYNTTIVHNTTTITNVTYVNRSVAGAVTAVPHQTFVSAQPVARAALAVNAREVASMPISSRAAFAPTANSVLGVHANTAGRTVSPPAAIARRAVVAKAPPPPPPVPFAARQQALAAHPGEPIAKQQMQQLRPANAPAQHPLVKQAPPGKPATPIMARPGNQPANAPGNRPGNPPASNQPGNRPGNPPASNERPAANPAAPINQHSPANRPGQPPAQNERPAVQPSYRPPEPNQPKANQPPVNQPRPNQPPNERPEATRPQPNQPAPNRPMQPPAQLSRPEVAQPQVNQSRPNQPQPNQRVEPNRPAEPPQRNEPAARPAPPPPRNEPAARPAQPPPHQPTPAEKKQQEEQRKKEEKKPPSGF
jgi:uncharacterized protein DUF6600